jgi:hypothetical protein
LYLELKLECFGQNYFITTTTTTTTPTTTTTTTTTPTKKKLIVPDLENPRVAPAQLTVSTYAFIPAPRREIQGNIFLIFQGLPDPVM